MKIISSMSEFFYIIVVVSGVLIAIAAWILLLRLFFYVGITWFGFGKKLLSLPERFITIEKNYELPLNTIQWYAIPHSFVIYGTPGFGVMFDPALVDQLTDDELAFVLAHEYYHSSQKHYSALFARMTGIFPMVAIPFAVILGFFLHALHYSLLTSYIVAATSAIVVFIACHYWYIRNLGAQEKACDTFALERIKNKSSALSALEKLQEAAKKMRSGSWLFKLPAPANTRHFAYAERINYIKSKV